MKKVGGITFKNNLFLAPLAGYSDAGFRHLAMKYGAALTFTEMISVKGLEFNNKNTESLLFNLDRPCAVQLFGSDPEYFERAAKNRLLSDFDIIDVNMGCPVPKIVKNNEGSALMKNPKLAGQIIKRLKDSTDKVVSVKMRLGFEIGQNTACDFAKVLEDNGADMICVHGRYREQYYAGNADYSEIKKVCKSVKIPVIANGDVRDKVSYERIMNETGAEFVMIGRGALGKPYIFGEITGYPYNLNIKKDILEHIAILKRVYEERVIVNNIKKHICYYAKGNPHASTIKEEVCRQITFFELCECINKYF